MVRSFGGAIVPGSRIRDPGSAVRDPGSELRDPGSGIRPPGSGVRDPESEGRDPTGSALELVVSRPASGRSCVGWGVGGRDPESGIRGPEGPSARGAERGAGGWEVEDALFADFTGANGDIGRDGVDRSPSPAYVRQPSQPMTAIAVASAAIAAADPYLRRCRSGV